MIRTHCFTMVRNKAAASNSKRWAASVCNIRLHHWFVFKYLSLDYLLLCCDARFSSGARVLCQFVLCQFVLCQFVQFENEKLRLFVEINGCDGIGRIATKKYEQMRGLNMSVWSMPLSMCFIQRKKDALIHGNEFCNCYSTRTITTATIKKNSRFSSIALLTHRLSERRFIIVFFFRFFFFLLCVVVVDSVQHHFDPFGIRSDFYLYWCSFPTRFIVSMMVLDFMQRQYRHIDCVHWLCAWAAITIRSRRLHLMGDVETIDYAFYVHTYTL